MTDATGDGCFCLQSKLYLTPEYWSEPAQEKWFSQTIHKHMIGVL